MAEIEGFCNAPFEKLTDVLSGTLDNGGDLGASVAITVEGELVADFWGGWADAARTTPWQRDTIVNVWSTTKTMTSLAALMLVDRGQLDVACAGQPVLARVRRRTARRACSFAT